MAITEEESRALNKIYRAIHDKVCPNCGGFDISQFTNGGCLCNGCRFFVTPEEMQLMRSSVVDWGRKPVSIFMEWRNRQQVNR